MNANRASGHHLRAGILAAVLGFALVAAAALAGPMQRPAASEEIQGDADCSGTVGLNDALTILEFAGGAGASGGCVLSAGDVDCDLLAGPKDALRIVMTLAGLQPGAVSGCTPIGEPVEPSSSFDKIGKALTNGTIDSETALVYELYAMFKDDRLPQQYRGIDAGGPPDDDAVNEAKYRFFDLSPDTRELVAPFLMPPIYEGSWLNPLSLNAAPAAPVVPAVCPGTFPGWRCVDSSGGKVRVWWQLAHPDDEARAQDIADEMDATIWPALTDLMGAPKSDAGVAMNGGSGAVDIYMEDVARSSAPAYNPGCEKTPAYINLARGDAFDVVAHEFMHVLQWSYDAATGCLYQPGGDYNWLMEATATWAQSWVYPDTQWEHYIADWYMKAPGLPLETANDRHEYGAYLFFLGLTESGAGEQVIRGIWDNLAQYGSLESINRAMAGGFDTQWPLFAGCLWNKEPVDCYVQIDDLTKSAAAFVNPVDVSLGGQTSNTLTLDGTVEHMGAAYFSYKFTDSDIESVVVRNTLAGYPHASVQALAKIDGQWKDPMDWSGQGTGTFCAEIPGQNIQELVILIANSDWELKGKLLPPEPMTLTASNVACGDWLGTATAKQYWFTQPTVRFDLTVTDLRFTYYETVGNEAHYTLSRSSAGTWHAYGTNGPCVISGEMHVDAANPFTAGHRELEGELTIYLDSGSYRMEITGYDDQATYTETCPGNIVHTNPWPYLYPLRSGLGPSDPAHPPTEDGRLDGEYTTVALLYSGTWEWHFDPAPPE